MKGPTLEQHREAGRQLMIARNAVETAILTLSPGVKTGDAQLRRLRQARSLIDLARSNLERVLSRDFPASEVVEVYSWPDPESRPVKRQGNGARTHAAPEDGSEAG
jgi:hypothetical protein